MRYKVFLDTNILVSGIFFEGNKSKILDMTEIDLVTCEDAVEELRKVTVKKLKYLDSYRESEKAARENRKGLWQSGEDTALVKSGSDLKPQRTKSEYNPGSKEYVKGYYRKNGTYVRGYYRNRKRS